MEYEDRTKGYGSEVTADWPIEGPVQFAWNLGLGRVESEDLNWETMDWGQHSWRTTHYHAIPCRFGDKIKD